VLNKDTSLGFIVGYAELLRRLQTNTQFFGQRYWFQFFVVGTAIYIAVNFTLSRIAVWLERRGSSKVAGGIPNPEDVEVQAAAPTESAAGP
jgi:glutamate transport system permease protein